MLLYVYVSMDPRGLIQINDDDDITRDDSVTSHSQLSSALYKQRRHLLNARSDTDPIDST